MKKIIIICTTLSFLIIPMNLSAYDGSVNNSKINRLETKMKQLTDKIDKIVLSSRKAKEISEKYKKIAMDHLNVVSKFAQQKSECQNLEDIYREKQSSQKLDRRVIKKQGKNVVSCYETLETLIYEFDDMNKDFAKLKKSVNVAKQMSETDMESIGSLTKQASIIEDLIKMEQKKINSFRKEVENYNNSN